MYSVLCDFDGTLITSNGKLLDDDLINLNKFLENNKLCLVSHAKLSKIIDFINIYKLDIDYYSIPSGIARINNIYHINAISKDIINNIFNSFNNDIYTAYTETLNKAYIFNYQDRLDVIYPKNNRVIIDNINEDLPALTIVISNEKSEILKDYLSSNNLSYDSVAKDKNREILSVTSTSISKHDAYNLIKKSYPNSKIVGITDSSFDLDMISECDIKIGMLNGDQKLKDNVDYITEFDNNNGGCIKELIKICR